MKRRFRALVVPFLFLAVTGYFVFNAVNGSRGIIAQHHNEAVLARDRATLAATTTRRDRWQARVDSLRHHAIQADMLDQQARSVLNLADAGDLVVTLKDPPGQPARH